MPQLEDDSLEFARAHIDAFYDSDFFPKADFWDALWSRWPELKQYLLSKPVLELPIQQPRAMPAPKSRGGYRIVHQLEPLDALKYTALAHAVAVPVEAMRVPETKECVYSYRFHLTQKSFFGKGNGYSDFTERCKRLSSAHSWVLTTDIADFYNRIYTHRLNNNIEHAAPALRGKAKDIEVLILKFNAKASQGIPVGPAASIIFSEAIMIDVDEFIASKGFVHCRYVDDIRVFSNDRSTLERLEEELAHYLYDGHRLHLSQPKTRLLSASTFSKELAPPEAHERRELLDICGAVCDYGDQLTDADLDELEKKYMSSPPKPASTGRRSKAMSLFAGLEAHERAQKSLVQSHVLESLFDLGVSGEHIDLGLVRHALRQARRLKTPQLAEKVLTHFDKLGPALPDAFLYLDVVTTPTMKTTLLPQIQALLSTSLFVKSRFVRHWVFWFLTSSDVLVQDAVLSKAIWTDAPIEFGARAARVCRNLSWLRSQKANLPAMGSWDRYAVLHAWEIMPKDEIAGWLAAVTPRDKVEELLVKWLRSLT